VNDAAPRQLVELARVVDSFERAGIDYSVFGGWAVDFHAGRVKARVRDADDAAKDRADTAVLAELKRS
jgi:hypothetical protein